MADNKIIKGFKVEVSSDESGFHGAWFVATLVDIVDKTPIKTNNNKKTPKKRFHKNNTTQKTGYLVKYDKLFKEEDSDENLCEMVDSRFVRPIPPMMVVEFKVDDVIDAYIRDGWWIGVIKKVINNAEQNCKKYLVSFENEQEEVEFEKVKLRFHVDWIDSCWKVPPSIKNIKTQEPESSIDIESNNESQCGFTTPCRVARPTDLENPSTCRLRSAKKRMSRLPQNTESNSEMTGAVEGPITYNLRKTKSRIGNSVEENSCGDRSQASAGGKRKNTVEVPVMERSGSQDMQQDPPMVEQEAITAILPGLFSINVSDFCKNNVVVYNHVQALLEVNEETSEAEEGQSQQKTKKGRHYCWRKQGMTRWLRVLKVYKKQIKVQVTGILLLSMKPLLTRITFLCLSGVKGVPVMIRIFRKTMIDQLVHQCRRVQPLSPTAEPTMSNKKSFLWTTIESTELYKKQKPHFSPLKKIKEGCREGHAIGHMVTFENVIQDVLNYKPSNPIEKIHKSLEMLDEVEPHGFDVSAVRGRLNTFLSLKVKVGDRKDEIKKFENEIKTCNVVKRAVEVQLNDLEGKIKELQEMKVQKVKMKAVKDQDIKRLRSNVDLAANQIAEAELEIAKVAAMPL